MKTVPIWDSIHLETTIKKVLQEHDWVDYDLPNLRKLKEAIDRLLPQYSTYNKDEYDAVVKHLREAEERSASTESAHSQLAAHAAVGAERTNTIATIRSHVSKIRDLFMAGRRDGRLGSYERDAINHYTSEIDMYLNKLGDPAFSESIHKEVVGMNATYADLLKPTGLFSKFKARINGHGPQVSNKMKYIVALVLVLIINIILVIVFEKNAFMLYMGLAYAGFASCMLSYELITWLLN